MILTRARICILPLLAVLALQAQDREWKRLSEFMENTSMDKFLSAQPERRDKVKLFAENPKVLRSETFKSVDFDKL